MTKTSALVGFVACASLPVPFVSLLFRKKRKAKEKEKLNLKSSFVGKTRFPT